jgi:hypothetical protein
MRWLCALIVTAAAPFAAADPAPPQLALPTLTAGATVPAESWTFVAFDRSGTIRVGAVPPAAVSSAGVDPAKLPAGKVVEAGALDEAAHELLRQRVVQEGLKPDPKIAYPTCGDPLPQLTGSGGERPYKMAPPHATACPLETPDRTARFATLILADRELPASTVLRPFVADHGVLVARFGVVTDGKIVRTVAVQIGQNTSPSTPAKTKPARARTLILQASSDPFQLAKTLRGHNAWVWVYDGARYEQLLTLIQALTVAGVEPVMLTLEDPRKL